MASVSINILTKGRVDCLKRLFFELYSEIKELSDIDNEVNIIDDSNESDKVVIVEWCENYGFKYNYVKGSISKKRNAAINLSALEIILFIDSDCYLSKNLIKQHQMLYERDNVEAVLGPVEFTGQKPLFWKVIEQAGFTIPFSFAKFMDYAMWGPCANISFRKDTLININGFKENYPFDYSGEDVDIGIRLNKHGYKIICNPSAIVYHDTKTWLNPLIFSKKIFRWGITDYYLMKDHKDMLFPEFARFSLVVFFLLIISLLSSFSLFVLPLFILTMPLFYWLFGFIFKNRINNNFIFNYLAFFLKQIFELGFILKTLTTFHFKFAFKKILYGQRQLEYEITDRICYSLSLLFSLILCIIIIHTLTV